MGKISESDKHKLMNLSDKIRKVGELEHMRFHAKRNTHVLKDEEEKLFWGVVARQSLEYRREFQKEYLDVDDHEWCPEKVACILKQINTEDDDPLFFDKIENLCDMVLSHILNEDLSGCESCAKDKADVE